MSLWQNVKGFFQEGIDIIRMIGSSMSDAPDAWDWSIARFQAEDRLHPPPPGVIVFTGSSSITLWKTLQQDMAPLPVLNRGFGGSKMHQVVHYADRVVIPYHPRLVVLFAGTNDIAGSNPKTAQQVFQGYLEFVREANRLIQAHTETDPRLHFIDMTSVVLGPDDKPDRSLFRYDGLHPNAKGYARWTSTIKPVLQEEVSISA